MKYIFSTDVTCHSKFRTINIYNPGNSVKTSKGCYVREIGSNTTGLIKIRGTVHQHPLSIILFLRPPLVFHNC